MAVTKWSVSVDENLAARVERRVGDRGLSAFVARAVAHELERDLLGTSVTVSQPICAPRTALRRQAPSLNRIAQ